MNQPSKRAPELNRLYLGAALIALIWVIFGIYKTLSVQVGGSLDAPSRWILVGVGIINVFAIAALLFMLVRIIAKLYFERRRGILGSKLRSRLVTTLFAVSIIPSLILFVVGQNFISKNVDRWFEPEVRNVLSSGKQIADELESNYQSRLTDAARVFKRTQNPASTRVTEVDIDLVGSLSNKNGRGWQLRTVDIKKGLKPPPWPKMTAFKNRILAPEGEWILQTIEQKGEYWVIGVLIPLDTYNRMLTIRQRYREESDVTRGREAIEILPQRTFTFLTLLTLFIAVWFGLALAKSLSEPIQSLAKAAQRVGSGDLEVELAITGKDELTFLAQSFNAMTRDLKKSQTSIREQSENIEQQRLYLDQLLSTLPVGVISWRASGELAIMNASACHLFGLQIFRHDLQPWESIKRLPGLDVLDRLKNAVRDSGRRLQEEFRIGGEAEGRLLRAFIEVQSDGGILAVVEDLSLLAQAEKRAAWQEVARRMAHEIKNPLTPIQLTAQLMLRKSREGRLDIASIEEGSQTILSEVTSLSNLVDSFSKFAQLPTPVFKACNPIELLQTVATLYEPNHPEIQWEVTSDPTCTFAKWDRDMIKRALINLIDNAVSVLHEYPPTKEPATIRLALVRKGSEVSFRVEDNGPGVLPENQEHLFEPYFSMKRKGTGLGLAIVQKIVEDHGGSTRYEALPLGSRFILTFPL
ncbi:MAG: ATP-binding protein [Holophagaceae bacterium]